MFLTFSKNPRWYTEKKGNQDPKKGILVLVIYINCVYDIGRFIVYLSYILFVYFFVGSGVGGLCT